MTEGNVGASLADARRNFTDGVPKGSRPPGWMFTDVLRETPRSGQSPNPSGETLRQQ